MYPLASPETRHAVGVAAAAASAAVVAHLESAAPATSTPTRSTARGTACAASGHEGVRKKRQPQTVGDKLGIICLKDTRMLDKTQDLVNVFPKPTSVATVRAVCSVRSRMSLQGRSASGEPLDSLRGRRSTMADVDRELRRWYEIVNGLGPDTLPLTMAVLQQRAREIGERLGVSGFAASTGFVRRWAARHNLVNTSLWGTGGSAATAVAAAQERMAQIRADLSAYEPDQIYNMDETGLFFRCLPNRAYVTAGRRRRVRGTKAMKAKDRVTLVLACNATGTHKIPVAIIGTAQVPVCFKPPRVACPLPYFNQKSAWMDADVYEKWFTTVFVPAVRARTSLPVALVVDNCGAHSKLEHPQIATISLPPNVTSVHQPLDAGIIAALKRRYKRRLLALVVEAFERTRVTQLADARGRQSASSGGPSAAGAPATGTGVTNRAPEGVVMEASRPTESATDGRVDGWGLTGPPSHRTATGESAGRGVTVRFQPHCEEGGEANIASVLGGARPVQSSSVAAAAGTTMVESGARAPARDDWATGDPPRLPARAVGAAAPIPLAAAARQASASAGLFGACAVAPAAPGPTGEPRAYVAPVVPSVPAHLPLRLPNVWVETPLSRLSQVLVRDGAPVDGALPSHARCGACVMVGRLTCRTCPSLLRRSGRTWSQPPSRTAG